MVRYLRTARIEAGFSLAQLSKEVGLAVGTLHNLERGLTDDPHPSTMKTLRDFFGVTWATLMEEVDDGRPKGKTAAAQWKNTAPAKGGV